MDNQQFDTSIIGSGPAGEGAAMKLAKAGQQVAGVDPEQGATAEYPDVGGLSS